MGEFFQDRLFLGELINLIRECHQIILDIYECDFEIISKDDQSPVTEADRLCNQHICNFLKKISIENSGIISEEIKNDTFQERQTLRWTWLVDPLDGTKEFIKKNGQFTVNIGLCEYGIPVFGIVGVPVSGDIYYGIKGVGSFKLLGEKKTQLSIPSKDMFLPQIRIVASSSHMNEQTRNYIQQFRDPIIVNTGSSIKLLWVAEGKADLYPRLGPTYEWDTCAAHAVVKYAGGYVLKFEDSLELTYNKENLLNPFFVVH